MNKAKWLYIGMIVCSWLSLPLIGRSSIKRFLPAALFIIGIVRTEAYIAKEQRWWWFYEKLHPRMMGLTPFIIGPFFVGTLWIMKFTYKSFPLFFITNAVVDSLFTYPFVNWLKKSGIASLVRINKLQLYALFMFKMMLLYGFQVLKERIAPVANPIDT